MYGPQDCLCIYATVNHLISPFHALNFSRTENLELHSDIVDAHLIRVLTMLGDLKQK